MTPEGRTAVQIIGGVLGGMILMGGITYGLATGALKSHEAATVKLEKLQEHQQEVTPELCENLFWKSLDSAKGGKRESAVVEAQQSIACSEVMRFKVITERK